MPLALVAAWIGTLVYWWQLRAALRESDKIPARDEHDTAGGLRAVPGYAIVVPALRARPQCGLPAQRPVIAGQMFGAGVTRRTGLRFRPT